MILNYNLSWIQTSDIGYSRSNNLQSYNMLGTESLGWSSYWPSVWCSKYYFLFIISWKILYKNPFNFLLFIYLQLYKKKKKRVLNFWNPSQQPTVLFSIYQNNTWTIRHLVDEMIDPATYRIIFSHRLLSLFLLNF